MLLSQQARAGLSQVPRFPTRPSPGLPFVLSGRLVFKVLVRSESLHVGQMFGAVAPLEQIALMSWELTGLIARSDAFPPRLKSD